MICKSLYHSGIFQLELRPLYKRWFTAVERGHAEIEAQLNVSSFRKEISFQIQYLNLKRLAAETVTIFLLKSKKISGKQI